jgi:hypothetical protein
MENELRILILEDDDNDAELIRICWPLICSPFVLETPDDLNSPIIWSPAGLPLQMIDDLNCRVTPADGAMRYFRVRIP